MIDTGTESDRVVVATANLTKVFKDFWLRSKVTAVADLDMDVMNREVFGLLGPNGSGKSTTLKMILGLMFPTRGAVAVFGARPTDVKIKARIGFLPEETYLYPFLDARETLDYYGRLFHQPRRERIRRIDMLLDMVGLAGVAYRRIAEYSKGMKRLIGMAQALINDPDLLILDEPTSGLDPQATAHFKEMIHVLAERGKTVILSSHLLADVEDICDRVCILYGGRRRAIGPLDDLLTESTVTQMTTEHLDERALAEVQEVLRRRGANLLDVSSGRNSLESVFLEIVKQAQSRHVATSGVSGAGDVAEFLRADESADAPDGQGVIDGLVDAGSAPDDADAPQQPPAAEPDVSAVAAADAEAAEAEQAGDVLDSLTAAKPDPQTTVPPPVERKTSSPSKPATAADQSVLDDLISGGDRQDPEGS